MTHISEDRLWKFAELAKARIGRGAHGPMTIPFVAYATLLAQGWLPEDGVVDDRVTEYMDHVLGGASGREDLPIGLFEDAELAAVVLSNDVCGSPEFAAPDSLVDLAALALDLNDGDVVADPCCGVGSFMVAACGKANVRFIGTDISSAAIAIALMRASVIGAKPELSLGNALEAEELFDKAFLQPPLGMNALYLEKAGQLPSSGFMPQGVRVKSADWVFAANALSRVREGGIVVAVMAGGPLFNAGDAGMRRHLVERGLVRAVVSLPERLMQPYTPIALNLVILSKGEATVRLVDATDLGSRERRVTRLTEDDVAEIFERIFGVVGERSADITAKDIGENGWSLDPHRYIGRVDVPNGVPLGSLVKGITRGVGISARELDERITSEATPYRYLMIKDVVDGEILEGLPNLTSIKPEEERYCLRDGDIVLGKMSPFKAAVAHLRPGERVLCTGNLYIIRPDAERATPVYLKLFLESSLGVSQLRDSCVGSTIRSVPVRALERVLVPEATMEEQERISSEYDAIRREIEVYQRRIERARERIAGLFPQGGEL